MDSVDYRLNQALFLTKNVDKPTNLSQLRDSCCEPIKETRSKMISLNLHSKNLQAQSGLNSYKNMAQQTRFKILSS